MCELQKNLYEKGFILINNLFDKKELNMIQKESETLISSAYDILKDMQVNNASASNYYRQFREKLIVVSESSNQFEICRFENISPNGYVFRTVVIEKIKKIINSLMRSSFVLFKDKCNLKRPGGGAFPPHQDIPAYSHFKPKFHLTAAFLLDDSTIENGCIEMALDYKNIKCRETQETMHGEQPLLDFYKGGPNNGNIKNSIAKNIMWKEVEGKKGDIILFNSYIPHRSKKNNSSNSRTMFFFTFNDEKEGDFYDKYYEMKMQDYNNPIFHVATPTFHDARTDVFSKE